MPATYPQITDLILVPFRAIEVQLDQYPDMLDAPECPYPPPIRAIVKRLVGKSATTVAPQDEWTEDDLVRQIQALYQEVQNTDVKGDPKDTIQLLKTRADLLTKLTSLSERALNARDMARFQRTVVETLESVCTPAQRNEFLEKLSAHVL